MGALVRAISSRSDPLVSNLLGFPIESGSDGPEHRGRFPSPIPSDRVPASVSPMTLSGINQDIELLGKTFHLQTQVSANPDLSVRTEIFIGGKLVATRESPLEEIDASDSKALREAMKAQHKRIAASVVDRARRYQERQQEESVAEAVASKKPAKHATDTGAPKASEDDDVPRSQGPTVEVALRVRRLYEQFRLRLLIPRRPSKNLGERLENAEREFTWILDSEIFHRIRIDEQLRFNLLHDQISEWLAGGRSPVRAAQIWSEVVAFLKYLGEVNNRAELAAFDRDLLRWALRVVDEQGMNERTLEHLSMIRGRDEDLDRLLGDPGETSREVWVAHFRRVLAGLEFAGRP